MGKREADEEQKRATGGKLDEKYIIVIARELAKALKACHNRHIMHRDVKGKACSMSSQSYTYLYCMQILTCAISLAGNLMIHEDGNVQLIDFGVSGIIDSKVGKRSTIIGTLNWMPPEQLNFLEPAKSVGGRKTPAKKEFGIEVS